MKTERRIHKIYEEFEEVRKKGINTKQLTGKYQYIFSNEKGKISLVRFLDYLHKGDNFWEIYCLEGNLFGDTERFSTKEKAIEKVKEYLGVDELSELIEEKLEMIKKGK